MGERYKADSSNDRKQRIHYANSPPRHADWENLDDDMPGLPNDFPENEVVLASSESIDLNTSLCSTARTLTLSREYYQRMLVHYCRLMQQEQMANGGVPNGQGGERRKSIIDAVFGSLSSNPYFSAGVGLASLGVAMAISKRLMVVGNSLFRRRFLSNMEIDNDDQAYPWVLDYINKCSNRRTNKITVNTFLARSEGGEASADFLLLPGRGTHYFTHKGRWIQVERTREKQMIQKHGVRTALETVTLSTIGAGPNFWKEFLEGAAKDALSKVESGVVIYTSYGPNWQPFGKPRARRPLSSMVLDTGIMEKLQRDIEQFFLEKQRYTNRGIPYRRGYLLYGPPGTGKSSFVSALAGAYGYNICMLTLSDRSLDEDRLNHLINNTPPYSFILLEDVDVASVPRDPANEQFKVYEGLSRVTMSGLLNSIDGVTSSEQRILFMTTNYVDKLDPALIRPGRVDVKQYFGNCTSIMLERMFKRFYENESEELCKEFCEKALETGREFSPAAIQGHLLKNEDDPMGAIENVPNLVKEATLADRK